MTVAIADRVRVVPSNCGKTGGRRTLDWLPLVGDGPSVGRAECGPSGGDLRRPARASAASECRTSWRKQWTSSKVQGSTVKVPLGGLYSGTFALDSDSGFAAAG